MKTDRLNFSSLKNIKNIITFPRKIYSLNKKTNPMNSETIILHFSCTHFIATEKKGTCIADDGCSLDHFVVFFCNALSLFALKADFRGLVKPRIGRDYAQQGDCSGRGILVLVHPLGQAS